MGFFDELKKSLFGEQPQGRQRRRRTSSASSKDKPPVLRQTKEKSRRKKKPTKRKTAKKKKAPAPAKPKKKAYQSPSADKTIVIEYLNYAGELKQFIGDPKSIVRKGNHFSVRVAPTFKRISLDRSKTRILKGVPAPAALPAEPLPVRTTTADTSIIQYTNWEGIHKEFKIITGVVDDKGDYVRVRVSPTFKYITLKRTRIGNPEALFDATMTAPSREVAPTAESEAEPTVTPAPADTVNLILTGCGIATYDATHVLRDLRPDLGTFDLYGMLRNFPQTVAENMPLEQAEAFKKQLEDAGCTVELK